MTEEAAKLILEHVVFLKEKGSIFKKEKQEKYYIHVLYF